MHRSWWPAASTEDYSDSEDEVTTRLDYNDTSDLSELISTMESANLPAGHSGRLLLYDTNGFHYATIEVDKGGNAALVLSRMSSEVQDT